MCNTLPHSLALATLKSPPLILCISHMQSQCAPWHLKSTTVFPLKSWKMTFCSQLVFFPGQLNVFMIFFSCSDVVLPFCDQRKPSVVFLIHFTFHVRIDIFVFMLWQSKKRKEKKTEEYYSHQLTRKPPEGKKHFTCKIQVLLPEYVLGLKDNISHTALPLTTRVSQIFLT